MLNGINISLTEPDALDRSILTEVARISSEERKELSQVMSEFDKLRPKLLGYVLDILVKALQIKDTIQLKNLPRMADFTVWGEAIARAMGYKEMEFINAYNYNIGKQNIEAIDAHPLGQAILKFYEQLEERGEEQEGYNQVLKWEGSPSELLENLIPIAQECKIDTNQRLWPKSPSSLSRRLNQIRSNLIEGLGIVVSMSRITSSTTTINSSGHSSRKVANNTSIIRIEKMPPAPPLPPVSENHEGNQAKNAGGISTTGGTIPPGEKMPPVENIQNHAQKSEIGGTGETGGILNISPYHDLLQYSNNNNAQNIEQKTQDCCPSQEQRNNVAIFRLGHSDIFACRYCKQRGDKWYMQKHLCKRGLN